MSFLMGHSPSDSNKRKESCETIMGLNNFIMGIAKGSNSYDLDCSERFTAKFDYFSTLNCSLPQVPPWRHLEAGGRMGENLYVLNIACDINQ